MQATRQPPTSASVGAGNRPLSEIQVREIAAAALALVGFLMFEVAAFYALRDLWSTIVAALILGAVNFVVAGILMLIANSKRPGRELDLANEIHKNTMDALQADARLLQADVASFGQALKHPVDSVLPLIVPPHR